MSRKGRSSEEFSNHPCHRLSVPSAKRFWCRHCFEMFDDPITRWRHSKTCKNTGLSNMTRRKEQEATALESYCESKFKNSTPEEIQQVILPNLNPRSTNKSYVGPKEPNEVDLSCFICKRQFTTLEEMKDHVRVPCNKAGISSDCMFPFPTASKSAEEIYETTEEEPGSSTMYEVETVASKKRTPSPLDPSNLSSETMAAVEALNMMARSDKVNLTQFLNQLSEGGFVIEQAAGTSVGGDNNDREIVFTVQGDVGQSGQLIQHGGDITVEVAEDLIRMAQRVRVETVERVIEEQVQEEVVQEDLEQQTQVHYIQDQAEFIQEQPQYAEEEQQQYQQYTEEADETQEHVQYVQEQTQDDAQDQTEYVHQSQLVVGQEQVTLEGQGHIGDVIQETHIIKTEPVDEESTQRTYAIVNMGESKEFVTEAQLTAVNLDSLPANAQVFVMPMDEDNSKNEEENLLSIPEGKRKLDDLDEGQVQVKIENGSQVKKICLESTSENVSNDNVEDVFEAKKKLQFFNEGLIVQEKCNKNFECTEKTLEIESKEPCDIENSNLPPCEKGGNSSPTPVTQKCRIFLDEVDGTFRPMTKKMLIDEENLLKIEVNILPPVEISTQEESSSEEIPSVSESMTVIKKRSPHHVIHHPSPKKLRSSSRKVILTPKKKKLLEERERRKKRDVRKSSHVLKERPKQVFQQKSEQVIKPDSLPKKNDSPPVEKPAEKTTKIVSLKQHKCRACDKIFNSLKQLHRHKTVPCVVKITRNLCQKILRPKRALPKPPEKKIVKKKVKQEKSTKKPKLLPVGFRIHAQWIPCKKDQVKQAKGRGRPRKHSIHYERKKHIVLPDKTLEVSSLSEKEQFFFELGLVCSEYIVKDINRSTPQIDDTTSQTDVTTSLSVSVVSQDKSVVDDMSPPLLEKIDPAPSSSKNEFNLMSNQNQDLGPPLLFPIMHDIPSSAQEEGKEEMKTSAGSSSHPLAESSGDITSDANSCIHKPDYESFDDDRSGITTYIRVYPDNCASQKDDQMPMSQNDKHSTRERMLQQLKEKLKTMRLPGKSSSISEKKISNSNCSPRKRNLFESMLNVHSNTFSSCPSSPIDKKLNQSRQKSQSAHSSPVKSPTILKRSLSQSLEPKDSILDRVAKSMGINVEIAENQDEKSTRQSLSFCESESLETNSKKNHFEKSESFKTQTGDSSVAKKSRTSARRKLRSSGTRPSVFLTASSSGQILVKPIERDSDSEKCPVTVNPYVNPVKHRSRNKLCNASTQSERGVCHSPVKTMLGDIEQKLKLLKSALKAQTSLQNDSEQNGADRKKTLVSVILKQNSNKLDKSILKQNSNKLGNSDSLCKSVESQKIEKKTDISCVESEGENKLSGVESESEKQLSCVESQSEKQLSYVESESEKQLFGVESQRGRNLPDVVQCVTDNITKLKSSPDKCDGIGEKLTNNSIKWDTCDVEIKDQSLTKCILNETELKSATRKVDCNSLDSFESEEGSTDGSSSEKMSVQYIDPTDSSASNRMGYFVIQSEGVRDYLNLNSDIDLDAGEIIHAVTVEDDIDSNDSLYTSSTAHTVERKTVDASSC